MKKIIYRTTLLVAITSLQFACSPVENSSTQDAVYYTDSVVDGGESFQKARLVMSQKCFGCHTHIAWKAYSENQFFSNNLASSGSLAGSKVYYRLVGAKSGTGPRDMPQSSSALTSAEIQLMENWILGL